MKICELKNKLIQAGVPSYLYNLDGSGRTDERYCLKRLSGVGWEVYYAERGVKTTDIVFSSEDEACDFIYQKLVG